MSSILQVIRKDELDKKIEDKQQKFNKKSYLIGFSIFIALILLIFGGILFVKDKFKNVNELQANLDFQKQKFAEERLLMEKTFNEEKDKLLKLQSEYEQKNNEVNEILDSIKVKQENLDSEILKVEELKDFLKKHLVDVYSFNMNKFYDNDEKSDVKSGLLEDEVIEDSIHTNSIVGNLEYGEKDGAIKQNRVLGIADADWFIKFSSLGEFSY